MTGPDVGKDKSRKRGFNREDLERAATILNCDLELKGRIWKTKCPIHGKENLTYYYYKDRLRVVIHCKTCHWQKDIYTEPQTPTPKVFG